MSDIIQIAYGETQMAVEDEVMKAVCNVGISVNKKELLRALELSESLVRCNECRFCKCRLDYSEYYCIRLSQTIYQDGYCSWGERRENE